MKVLYVDGDDRLAGRLEPALREDGITVLRAATASGALSLLREERPDIVLLEVDHALWNGFDLLRVIRAGSEIPVVLFTARRSDDDKVRGFEWGADDYVTKPFSYRELVVRLRALLRRTVRPARAETAATTQAAAAPAPAVLLVGSVALNPRAHTVERDGRRIRLSPTEFRLLHLLMSCAGVLVPTSAILDYVWPDKPAVSADALRVTLFRLRRRLGDDASRPELLHTVAGVGAVFGSPAPEASPASHGAAATPDAREAREARAPARGTARGAA